MSDDAFQERLRQIRAGYVAKLAGQADEIEALLDAAAPESARDQIVARVHRLAGTAGSFGFAALSARANDIEMSLLEGASVSDSDQALRELVSLMRASGDD